MTQEREASERLRLSEERFRLIVETVREYAIFMLDPQGIVTSWNAGAERINGYRADEIIGRHFSTFYVEADRERGHPQAELVEALAAGSYAEEGWRVKKDGSTFWCSVVITALFDESRQHIGFAKVTRDLSETRKFHELLRESEERLRFLVEGVRDYAIFMLAPDGTIITWNSGAQALKGYAASEIIGKHFRVFYPPADAAAGRPERELEIAVRDGRYEEEGWRLRKDGELFWANVVINAVFDPVTRQLRGFAKITRDLTERRRVEQAARIAADEAAVERARAIDAKNAVKARDEFISVAAHELRTPLTALQLKIQGVSRALRTAGDDRGSTHAQRLDGALRQIDRLSGLVERLLDVSRIVQGKLTMNIEEIDLAELVENVVEDFRLTAAEVGSEIRVHAASSVVGRWDRARIEQVAVNLLTNAIKYGGGNAIDVDVSASQGNASLVVADRGIGISPQDTERIFARFERAAPISHYAGLGLGLYITRNIVEAHGGSIRVSSKDGHGSTFSIVLPARMEDARS